MKTICIDYDGSYTEFPELFNIIIYKAKELDYKVILATMRSRDEEDETLRKLSNIIDVVYTNRRAKIPYLNECFIYPDLFIDDNPMWLYQDSK